MNKIKELRKRKASEFTISAVAKLIGVSSPTYRKIEQDPCRLTFNQATKIAEHLGCPVEDLFLTSNDN